jgi:hypothetical protein
MIEPRPISAFESSIQVLVRFALRAVLLTTFASFSSHGFGKALVSLLTLAAIFCMMVATMRREQPTWSSLSHWDEAAMYATIAGLMASLA